MTAVIESLISVGAGLSDRKKQGSHACAARGSEIIATMDQERLNTVMTAISDQRLPISHLFVIAS
jgi:hypothetical protein